MRERRAARGVAHGGGRRGAQVEVRERVRVVEAEHVAHLVRDHSENFTRRRLVY